MIIAVTLVAAMLLGIGFVLQQRAAARAPVEEMLRLRLLVRLIRSPQWLCGIACMVAGQIVSAIALSLSTVSLVEPLLASNLLVALLLAGAVSRQPLRRSDWIGCLVLGAGLAAFIAAGNPTQGTSHADAPREWIAIGVIAAIAAGLVAASRGRRLTEQSTMLAGAAGCLAGLQDGFTRSTMLTLERTPWMLFTTWLIYAVVGVAVIVILLTQSAFNAAPLRHALPAVTVAEPLAGIAFGVVAFGDQLRTAPWAIAVQVIALAAMGGGVYVIATSALLASAVNPSRDTRQHNRGDG